MHIYPVASVADVPGLSACPPPCLCLRPASAPRRAGAAPRVTSAALPQTSTCAVTGSEEGMGGSSVVGRATMAVLFFLPFYESLIFPSDFTPFKLTLKRDRPLKNSGRRAP